MPSSVPAERWVASSLEVLRAIRHGERRGWWEFPAADYRRSLYVLEIPDGDGRKARVLYGREITAWGSGYAQACGPREAKRYAAAVVVADAPPLLTIEETAERLGVSVETVKTRLGPPGRRGKIWDRSLDRQLYPVFCRPPGAGPTPRRYVFAAQLDAPESFDELVDDFAAYRPATAKVRLDELAAPSPDPLPVPAVGSGRHLDTRNAAALDIAQEHGWIAGYEQLFSERICHLQVPGTRGAVELDAEDVLPYVLGFADQRQQGHLVAYRTTPGLG